MNNRFMTWTWKRWLFSLACGSIAATVATAAGIDIDSAAWFAIAFITIGGADIFWVMRIQKP